MGVFHSGPLPSRPWVSGPLPVDSVPNSDGQPTVVVSPRRFGASGHELARTAPLEQRRMGETSGRRANTNERTPTRERQPEGRLVRAHGASPGETDSLVGGGQTPARELPRRAVFGAAGTPRPTPSLSSLPDHRSVLVVALDWATAANVMNWPGMALSGLPTVWSVSKQTVQAVQYHAICVIPTRRSVSETPLHGLWSASWSAIPNTPL